METTQTKFIKEKYISEPIKVGDIFLVPNSKPGYYNYRRITSIDNNTVMTEIIEQLNTIIVRSSNGGSFYTKFLQKYIDDIKKEKHDKEQKHLQEVFNFCKKIKLHKVIGGDLKSFIVRKEFSKLLNLLEKESSIFKTENNSIPAGGFSGANSSTMFSMRSGSPISLSFNDCHRGGTYGFDRIYNVQIRIGGALPYENIRILSDVSKKLLSKFSYETVLGKSRIDTTDGTNWSSVMMIAPSKDRMYSPLNINV